MGLSCMEELHLLQPTKLTVPSRAKVTVVDGIHRGELEVLGLFTHNGVLINKQERPRGIDATKELMEEL